MRHTVGLFAVAVASLLFHPHHAGAQALRGSRASVELMYAAAQRRDLLFLHSPAEVYAAALSGALELVSITDDLELEGAQYPFVLPNTLRFADSIAAAYHAGCGERIVLTSGARPLDEQPRNASPKSVHPTGMAIDFRKPRTPACLTWLRRNLLALENRDVIEATEERRPAHFHVAVLNQLPEQRLSVAAADIVVPRRARSAAATRQAKHSRRSHKKKPVARAPKHR
jgi:hypothetical protein